MDPRELECLLHLLMLPRGREKADARRRLRRGELCTSLAQHVRRLGQRALDTVRSEPRRRRVDLAVRALDVLGVEILLESDPHYPERLTHLHDRPRALFLRGDTALLESLTVAIVGARQATPYARESAHMLARDIAAAGVVIVSGVARGVDTAAHVGAFEGRACGGASTIGVLGCGIDVSYPPENAQLIERIASEGLLVSEFPPGEPARGYNFPQRNRVIAALSNAVVVVEAAETSGALITSREALELGREVFAVPGPIGRPGSVGTHALLRDGAGLATCAGDVLFELGLHGASSNAMQARPVIEPANITAAAQALWHQLCEEPAQLDDLAVRAGTTSAEALGALLELELAGHARQLAGMHYVRSSQR
jgi:DNA processing protein